jgi:hypothetical protein
MKVWREATQKPPLGAILNWDAPINRGKVGCWLFNEGAGGSASNIVTQSYGTVSTPAVLSPDGLHAVFTDPTHGNGYLSDDIPAIAGALTVVIRRSFISQTAGADVWGMSQDNRVNGQRCFDLLTNYSVTAEDYYPAFLVFAGTSAYSVKDTNKWTAGTVETLVGTRSGVSMRLYRQGALTAGNESGPSGAINSGFGRLGIGRNSVDTELCSNGVFEYGQLYSRALSVSEVLELYREPYGLGQYLVPGIPVFYSIAAGVSAYGPLIGDGNLIGGGILVGVGGLV